MYTGSGDNMNFNTGEKAGRQKKTDQKPQEKHTAGKTEQMRVMCSGILRKNGEKIIYVRFERGSDYAEGSIPAAKITSQSGFAPEEIAQFEDYLSENKFEIIEQAKTVNLMKNFLR